MASQRRQTQRGQTATPDGYDLEHLSGRMLARALGIEVDGEEAEELQHHELAQTMLRWLRRQDVGTQRGLMASYGLGGD